MNALIKACKIARSGGTSLLRSLNIEDWQGLPIAAIEDGSRAFPELEHLSFMHAQRDCTFSFTSRITIAPRSNSAPAASSSSSSSSSSSPASGGGLREKSIYALLPFNRLKTVVATKKSWAWQIKVHDTAMINNAASSVIGTLLRSAPLLTSLSYTAPQSYISKKDLRGGYTRAPDPVLRDDVFGSSTVASFRHSATDAAGSSLAGGEQSAAASSSSSSSSSGSSAARQHGGGGGGGNRGGARDASIVGPLELRSITLVGCVVSHAILTVLAQNGAKLERVKITRCGFDVTSAPPISWPAGCDVVISRG